MKVFNLRPVWLLALIIAGGVGGNAKVTHGAEPSASRPAEPPASRPAAIDWKSEIQAHNAAFRALFAPGTIGNGVPEMSRFDLGYLGDGDARIAQLQKSIRDFPKSPFADDAALLLARSDFIYKNDPDKAVAELYKVIQDYPDGTWIAEDPVILEDVAVLNLNYGNERMAKALESEPMREKVAYLDYLAKNPNRTVDEAKLTIAWVIWRTQNTKRFEETAGLLRQVIADHANPSRAKADRDAAEKLQNNLLKTNLERPERRAYQFLIRILVKSGKVDEAKKLSDDFFEIYNERFLPPAASTSPQ